MVSLYLIDNKKLFYCVDFANFDSAFRFAKNKGLIWGKSFYISTSPELHGRKINF